jgi:hypothetical protein
MKRFLVVLFLLLPIMAYGATSDFDDGDGFEAPWAPKTNIGNWTDWGAGTPTSSGTAHDGSVAMSVDASNETVYKTLGDDRSEIWVDFWIYPDTDWDAGYFDFFKTNKAAPHFKLQLDVGDGSVAGSDGTNGPWDTTVTLTEDQWYHIFLHIEMAGGDGSETVQIAVNQATYWDAWDYDSSATTLVPTVVVNHNLGAIDKGAACNAVIILDTFTSWYGATMPTEWVAPAAGGAQIIIVN